MRTTGVYVMMWEIVSNEGSGYKLPIPNSWVETKEKKKKYNQL